MVDQATDDPLYLPPWLIRTAKNTPKRSFGGRKPIEWTITPAMQAQLDKDKVKAEREAACDPVLLAVLAGHSTVGKIKNATGLETPMVQRALRTLCKRRAVAKLGRQYLPF